jgi:hypothetical protein
VERAGGVRLPGALVLPLGLSAVMVIAGLTTAWAPLARFSWPLVLIVAIAGWASSVRRIRRPDPWLLVAVVGVFAVYAAPFVLSGENTFGGYIKLDDTATWLNITDQVMSHGRDLSKLAPSSYQANLHFYLGTTGYPLGSFTPLGVARPLVGEDLAWLFQPYLSFLAAALALALHGLAAPLVPSRRLRAGICFVAAQSALVYAFAMWGGVKELAAAVLLALLAALAEPLLSGAGTIRETLPLAVASAATLAVLGPGAAPWLAPVLLGVLGLVVARRRAAGELRFAGRQAAGFAGAVVVLAIPTWLLTKAFLEGGGPLYTGGGLFNLFHPLNVLQIGGIWPVGDFRLNPPAGTPTTLLVGLALASAFLGAVAAVRRRAPGVVLYLAAAVIGCAIVAAISSPWVTAKGLVTASPAVLLAAGVGAATAPERWRRLVAPLVIGLLAVGVLWSNGAAYSQVNLAPRDRLAEIGAFAGRIAGRGPTLTTEPELYADRHFLRAADPEGASDYRPRQDALSDGRTLVREAWADLDSFAPASLVPYRTLVVRRSPVESRPPFPFERTWRGLWYEIWERPARPAGTLLEHDPFGDQNARPYCGQARLGTRTMYMAPCSDQPAAVPPCRQIERLGASARARHAHLLAVPRDSPPVLEPRSLALPPGWNLYPGSGLVFPARPGTASGTIFLPRAGRYDAWLGGSFGRGLAVSLDGRPVGQVRYELSNNGQYVRLGAVDLGAGPHRLALRYGDSGLHPGSAQQSNPLGPFVLEPLGAADRPAITVAPARARELCGRSLDWVEIVV